MNLSRSSLRRFRPVAVLVVLTALLFLADRSPGLPDAPGGPGVAEAQQPPGRGRVTPKVFSGDVRSLPRPAAAQRGDPPEGGPEPPPISTPRRQLASGRPDPVRQATQSVGDAHGALSAPIVNFEGIPEGPGTSPNTPDTVGDVGPNHYVQMVNVVFQIFDKQGNSLAGPVAINSLWAGAGGACQAQNDGDPIVVYDHLADRWLLSQFVATGPPFAMCIAISRGPNPVTSGFFLYEFTIPAGQATFPDYPKIGVWPDAYYMSSYEGAVLGPYAFDRANMLNGNPATVIEIPMKPGSLNPTGNFRDTRILPADLDGPLPPAQSPNFFVRTVETQQDSPGLPADRLEIWEFRVNWGVPANSTFTLVQTLAPADFAMVPCAPTVRDCIQQPDGGALLLDALSNRLMMQLKYRNFGTHESMVVNQTVDADGNGNAGIRWYELRRSPVGMGAWAIHQQGTFAPQQPGVNNTTWLHRWMGSMAIDRSGNIALGYSIVNADQMNPVFPGIRYTGRLASDPLGLLPQGEETIINGLAAKIGNQRWGDYSAMNVDPVDDCTFWYTTEYIDAMGNWRTRIASFSFPACVPANNVDLSITKTDMPDPVFAGQDLTYTISVRNNSAVTATNVVVSDTLPMGVTHLANTGGCMVAGQMLTCTRASLNGGDTWTFTITVKVASDYVVGSGGAGTLSNTATVTADQPDTVQANNSATATTTVRESADLRVGKTCKPDTPAQTGSTATCTISVDNLGPSDARDVVLTDAIVSNGTFTIQSATFTPPMGSNCTFPAGPQMGMATITCNLGVEPAGGTTTITVSFTSNSAVDVNDTATVTSATPDPNPENNRATGRVSFAGSADLAITKTAAPSPVIAGTNLTYTVTVSNLSQTAAQNVVMKDVLPNHVNLVSATISPMAPERNCGGPAMPPDPLQPLTCNLGTVANGSPVTVTIVVAVVASAPNGAVLVNDATVSSDFADPNNANNRATTMTNVITRADLVIDKTSDLATYKPSSVITWTVKVTNNGPSDALAVAVTDTLPATRQAQYLSDTGGCRLQGQGQNQRLLCEFGALKPGESKSFDIKMTVRGSRGDVTNAVSVTSSTTDPTPANNTDSHTVTIQGGG